MGGNEQSIVILISQLQKYWLNKIPYDLSYNISRNTSIIWWLTCPERLIYLQRIAIKLFSIIPYLANCERIFSVLKWFYEQWHTRLDSNQILKMAKIYQLKYYGNLLSDKEIQNQVLYITKNLMDSQEIEKEIPLNHLLINEENGIEESQYAR